MNNISNVNKRVAFTSLMSIGFISSIGLFALSLLLDALLIDAPSTPNTPSGAITTFQQKKGGRAPAVIDTMKVEAEVVVDKNSLQNRDGFDFHARDPINVNSIRSLKPIGVIGRIPTSIVTTDTSLDLDVGTDSGRSGIGRHFKMIAYIFGIFILILFPLILYQTLIAKDTMNSDRVGGDHSTSSNDGAYSSGISEKENENKVRKIIGE